MSRDEEGDDPTADATSVEPETADPDPLDEDETLSGRARVLKFARRMMDRREVAQDTRELLSAVLSTSDKAKTEAVRLMAREFRGYLRELKLKDELMDLMRSHSLEISIHLKPLAPDPSAPPKDDEGAG